MVETSKRHHFVAALDRCTHHDELVHSVGELRKEIHSDIGGLRNSVVGIDKNVSAINARLDLVIDGKVSSRVDSSGAKAISDTARLLIKVVLFSAAIAAAVVGIVVSLQ